MATPRTELDDLLKREEVRKAGVYILSGTDPLSGQPSAYIGEAEVIGERLKTHDKNEKMDWISAIVFVSSDENLTKAHAKYLEGRLIDEAKKIGRFKLENGQSSGSKLPESDCAAMDEFFEHIRQLLPVLGSNPLVPILPAPDPKPKVPKTQKPANVALICKIKGALASGQRTPDGFVVFKGSTAVLQERPKCDPYVNELRRKLVADGSIVKQDGFYVFVKDVEFASPSVAASVIHGGGANGLIEWRTQHENNKALDKK